MKIFNRKLIATAVTLGTVLISSSAFSAITDGNLNFSFQGFIPPKVITPGSWEFVDISGASYTPSTLSLSTSEDGSGGYSMSLSSPEVFAIKASKGSFTSANPIQATLAASSVSGSALTGDTSVLETKININGQSLSSTAATIPVSTLETRVLTLTADLDIPAANVSPLGGTVVASSAIIFSVDIAPAIGAGS